MGQTERNIGHNVIRGMRLGSGERAGKSLFQRQLERTSMYGMSKIRLQLDLYTIEYMYIGTFTCYDRSSFSVRL